MKKLFLLTALCCPFAFVSGQSNSYGLKGFGDSITWGMGSSIGNYDNDSCWFARLHNLLGVPAHNYGMPGSILYIQDPSWQGVPNYNLVNQAATSLASDLPYGYVTFMIGTNDHVNDFVTWKATYKATVQNFINAGYDPQRLILCAPPYNSMWSMAPFQPVVQQIANELHTLYADVYSLTLNHNDWLADQLHPNNIGHLAIATYIYNVIQSSHTVLPVKFKSVKLTRKTQ